MLSKSAGPGRNQWRALSYSERILQGSRQLPNGCWEWLGTLDRYGYGKMTYNGRMVRTHRVAYFEFVGDIQDGYAVDHLCHSRDISCREGDKCPHRRCVNPHHLEVVTPAVNSQRNTAARQPTCVNGHPKDEANSYILRGRVSNCRSCNREAARRRAARKKADLAEVSR